MSDSDDYSSQSSIQEEDYENEEEYLENISVAESNTDTYSETDTEVNSVHLQVVPIYSDYDDYDDYDYDYDYGDYDEDEEISYQIYLESSYFQETEKIIGKYYFGLYVYNKIKNEFVMLCVISPEVFYKYSYHYVETYLSIMADLSVIPHISDNAHFYLNTTRLQTTIQIMKHTEKKGTIDIVILKTFWLKIVQRTWKRVFKERKRILKEWKSPSSLKYSEINGHFEKRLPTIYGMLK